MTSGAWCIRVLLGFFQIVEFSREVTWSGVVMQLSSSVCVKSVEDEPEYRFSYSGSGHEPSPAVQPLCIRYLLVRKRKNGLGHYNRWTMMWKATRRMYWWLQPIRKESRIRQSPSLFRVTSQDLFHNRFGSSVSCTIFLVRPWSLHHLQELTIPGYWFHQSYGRWVTPSIYRPSITG